MNKKCVDCAEYKNCKESSLSWVFFIIGIIATIAVRVVTVLVHINPVYGQIAWYVGVIGFFIFFVYKFKLETARARAIKDSGLMERFLNKGEMEKNDRELIGSLLCAFSSSKDRINYFLIFLSSALALILAFYLDFMRVR